MSLDKEIGELRESIENMPSMSEMLDAMRAGNSERADEIVGIEAKLKSDFNGVFTEFKADSDNAEKLAKYASVILDLRPKMNQESMERVVFLLYVNNSVEGVNMALADAGSLNFNQLVGEYIEWDKFREHFGDSDIPEEFYETEGREIVSNMGGDIAKGHMKAIFIAMKFKFQF